jgi:hypothetical protein
MKTKFTFIINQVNDSYVIIAKAYNDEGDISSLTDQANTIEEIFAIQASFYNTNKTGE